MKKKVLYLITKSNFGGAQRYVYELSTSLPKDAYDVAVAFGGTGEKGADAGSLKTMLEEKGVRTIFLSRFARDIGAFDDFKLFFDISALLKKEKPDILHINSSKAGGLGALAGRFAGVGRIIFTAHGWPHREKRPVWQKALIGLASWATVLLSDETIAVSEKDARTAPAFLKRASVRLIRNGIAPFATAPRTDARAELSKISEKPLPEDALVIGAIAELTKNKALDVLIRALKNVPGARLVIIGQGEERGRLELLASDIGVLPRVSFAGFVPDARRLLPAFDIYALSSLKEGLPYVLLEAGMAGIPSAATDVGGVPEIVKTGETGILVPPQQADALAAALEKLARDAALRSSYGARARTAVTEKFSFARMLGETLKLYRD